MKIRRLVGSALLGLTASALAWEWLAVAATAMFFRHAYRNEAQDPEPDCDRSLSVLVPMKGASEINRRSIRSLLAQDYPEYDVIVGVEDSDTPAIELVRALQQEPGGQRLKLAAASNPRGGRSQVNNLTIACRQSNAALLAMVDADIVAGPEMLRQLSRPLSSPGVGLTTYLYREVSANSIWSVVDGLWTSTAYLPSALLGRYVIGETFAFSAARGIQRDIFEKIGGFGRIDPRGADDYQFGQLVAAIGLRVRFLPYLVEEHLPPLALLDLLNRRIRWFRRIRSFQPLGYAGYVLTHGIPLALLALAVGPRSRARVYWTALVIANRMLGAALNRRRLEPGAPALQLLLVPVRDSLALLVWAAGFTPARTSLIR